MLVRVSQTAYLFRRVRKIAISGYEIQVCPSLHMEQLCSQWTDFYEISYLNILQSLSIKLKFNIRTRITGTLHKVQYTLFNHILLSSSLNEKCFRQTL